MTAVAEQRVIERTAAAPAYSKTRLLTGLIGRSWLWFIAASVAISVIPILFGWNSYLIVTGSMEPNISAGDIVISSPRFANDDLLGRVITFEDPAIEDHILTHRVQTINEDGTLITKGDANPTPDSAPVAPEAVTGMGRVLVRFVGLPIVWAMTGNWLMLALFITTVAGAIAATVRDWEPHPAPRPNRSIPSMSGLALLVIVVGLVFGTHSTSTARAAFAASTGNQANQWLTGFWSYTDAVNDLGPYLYWKLDETWGSTAADASGNGRTGTYIPNGSGWYFTRLSDGALETETPDRAVRLTSNSSCINTTSTTSINAPQVFTVIAWFRAPWWYGDGGKILGFERPRTGVLAPTAGAYDRHLYMDGNGRIWFGAYNNGQVALNSAAGMNDGGWHMAVATQSSAGMRLYIDGVLVDSNSNTVAETQTGWWRAGCGNLAGWGGEWGGNNNPGTNSGTTQNRTFRADLDELTVFTSALTATEVADLYDTR